MYLGELPRSEFVIAVVCGTVMRYAQGNGRGVRSFLTQSVTARVCSLDISGGTADRAGKRADPLQVPRIATGLHPHVLRSDVLPIARSAPGTPVPALMAALIERRSMETPSRFTISDTA